jgi:uncharacterized protein YecE (DUF72 family)
MTPTSLGPVMEFGDCEVRVGTCSWTDRTLLKDTSWYPKKSMSAAERLAFYSERFAVVEADSTYYRAPTTELASGWAERTPEGFRMNVKAFSLMTGHPTKPEALWSDVRDAIAPEFVGKKNVYPNHLEEDALDAVWYRFADALQPLRDAGRLGAVLLQYPEWFTPKRDNRDELARARKRLDGLPIAVEFRSPLWLAKDDVDRTLGWLSDHELTLVAVDAPKVSKLPRTAETTADLSVVRFHGRADDTWKARTTTAAERFKYLYDKRELRPWVGRVEELARESKEVHVLFNNCYQDYGVHNAADMTELLERALN